MSTRSAVRARRLTAADSAALRALLDSEPVEHVYLRSELRLGLEGGDWWGIAEGDSLRAAVLGGSLAVPCIPRSEDAPVMADAMSAGLPPRMLVGPRGSVLALRDALLRVQRPREVRDPQPLLVVGREAGFRADAAPVRLSTAHDLDGLIVAAAAMHQEEMGVDPLQIDASAWRARMVSLIERGWSWVWSDRGEVVFKAELSAWTPEVLQIQGVYTSPARRRQGVATSALAAVCARLLEQVPICSLYVNDYNGSALRLYDRLGFRRAGEFATVIY